MGGLSDGRIKIWGGVGFPGCYPFTTEWQVMAMICLGYGFAAPIAVHILDSVAAAKSTAWIGRGPVGGRGGQPLQ